MKPKWWVLASVGCGTFMATLDSSIVNIALPTLTKELGPDLYRVKWVVIIYLLVITCTLLPFGRLSDLIGRKPVFQIGYFIFILGSALCGLSPDLRWLIFFRVIQGLGAAMLMSNGPAIITSTFTARERGAALGTLSMVVSVGLVSGPSIGGFLIAHLGWRSIFWLNIPIGALGIVLVYYCVKNVAFRAQKIAFDWAGVLVQTLVFLLFISFFDPPVMSFSGGAAAQIPRWILGILVLILGTLFVRIEAAAKSPLFDFSLLKNEIFFTANLAGFLTFVSFAMATVLMPFFLEEVLHFAPERAGLFMTAIPLVIFIVAPMSGRLSDRYGSKWFGIGGTLVGALALFSMSGSLGEGLHERTPQWAIILSLAALGLSTGLFQSPNNSAIMGAVPMNKLGIASALLATVRNLGFVTGTGLATSTFSWRMAMTGDFVSAFHTTVAVAGCIAGGAVIASLGKRKKPRRIRSPQSIAREIAQGVKSREKKAKGAKA